MPNRLYIRKFLNKRGHHAGGYILVAVEDTSKRSMDHYAWGDVTFTIADCGRQIDLSFDTGKGFQNSIHKVDVMLDALTRLRAALIEEGKLEAERHKAREAQRKTNADKTER